MDSLFDMTADWGPNRFFRCGYCEAVISATENAARAAGWRTFEGVDQLGNYFKDAICPECYRRPAVQADRTDEVNNAPLVDTALYDTDGRAGTGTLE